MRRAAPRRGCRQAPTGGQPEARRPQLGWGGAQILRQTKSPLPTGNGLFYLGGERLGLIPCLLGCACVLACRWNALQQSCSRQIFVKFWPVQSKPCRRKFPMIALVCSRMQECRIPSQRHRQCASIPKVYDQAIFGKMSINDFVTRLMHRRIHPKPTYTQVHVFSPALRSPATQMP